MKLFSSLVVGALVALLPRFASADSPVVVAYVAPPECASVEAFRALLATEVARTPNPSRTWRFSVEVHRDGDYVGTLETETSKRELRAPTCDEVTEALALVIATAQGELPSLPAPKPVAPPPPPPPPPPAVTLAPVQPVARDAAEPAKRSATWRIGMRAERWEDGSQVGLTGAFVTAGLELPWGFPKMHFELGAGAMFMPQPASDTEPPNHDTFLMMMDLQACPIDLPIGSTGIDVLGCGRLAFGLTKNTTIGSYDYGAGGWAGGGAHVRWQSPWRLFVDAHFEGLYGTRIEGVPALMDFGGSIGLKI